MARLRSAAVTVAWTTVVWYLALAGAGTRAGVRTFEFSADPPAGLFTGLYGAERAPDGTTYAWSEPRYGLTLPGLDRTRRWHVTFRQRAARPDGSTPGLIVAVDGIVTARTTLPHDMAETVVEVPERAGDEATYVTLQVETPYVPDGDPRQLGALIDAVSIAPTSEGLHWPTQAVMRATWPLLALVLLWGLLRPPLGVMFVATTVICVATAAVIVHGLGGVAPSSPLVPAVTATLAGAIAAWMTRNHAQTSLIVGITGAAVWIKLLILGHPAMPIGDAMFQAHRFQYVLSGTWYFTSITPGDYLFPYAPGLFGVAALLQGLADSTLERMTLLRALTTGAEGVVVAGLAIWIGRAWPHAVRAGAIAVVAYHVLPVPWAVLATGNLTNMFGQTVALAAVLLVAGGGATWTRAAVAAGVISLAVLSHTGTFVLLSAHLGLCGLLLSARPDTRRDGLWLLATLATAVVVSIGLYYGHFGEVYRDAWTRITAETGQATAAAGGRTPAERLGDVPRLLGLYYSIWALGLAALGAVAARHIADSRSGPLLTTWAISTVGFLVLGVVSPVDFRHYYAAAPLVAIAVGLGVGEAERQSRVGLLLAGLALAATAWQTWLQAMERLG
jgi:hypothetical protein